MEKYRHSYREELEISIWAYYDDGRKSVYYRKLYLADLPKWLDAHTLTHPNCVSYTIKVDDPNETE